MRATLQLTCVMCVALFTSTQARLKISVYYEALCPDSISFIKKQLYPSYLMFGNHLDIEMVPYGKAIHNLNAEGKWVFQCQHGQSECYGNKVQACALKNSNYTFAKQMEFINCLMSSSSPDQFGERCANKVNISYAPISDCAHSETGDKYLVEMGDKTHGLIPQVSFVPTIRFNDVYDNRAQWDALTDLKTIICLHLGEVEGC